MKLALDLDAVLGDTRPLWRAWLEDAARRFRPITPLDPDALPEDRGEAARELDAWAAAGVGDWRGALERYAEERAPLFFRPDPATNATLRRLRAAGAAVAVFTDAPEPLARVALAHLGSGRLLDTVEAGPRALDRLLARLGPDTHVVRDRAKLAQLGERS